MKHINMHTVTVIFPPKDNQSKQSPMVQPDLLFVKLRKLIVKIRT